MQKSRSTGTLVSSSIASLESNKNETSTSPAALRGQFMATQMFHDLLMDSTTSGPDSVYDSSSPSMSVHSNHSSDPDSPHSQSTNPSHSSPQDVRPTSCVYSNGNSSLPTKYNYSQVHGAPLSHHNYGYYYNTILNKNPNNNEGLTVLHLAAENGQNEILRYFDCLMYTFINLICSNAS